MDNRRIWTSKSSGDIQIIRVQSLRDHHALDHTIAITILINCATPDRLELPPEEMYDSICFRLKLERYAGSCGVSKRNLIQLEDDVELISVC